MYHSISTYIAIHYTWPYAMIQTLDNHEQTFKRNVSAISDRPNSSKLHSAL